jgi:hypothetical protein
VTDLYRSRGSTSGRAACPGIERSGGRTVVRRAATRSRRCRRRPRDRSGDELAESAGRRSPTASWSTTRRARATAAVFAAGDVARFPTTPPRRLDAERTRGQANSHGRAAGEHGRVACPTITCRSLLRPVRARHEAVGEVDSRLGPSRRGRS